VYAAAAMTLHAQTFTTLFSFNGTDGSRPFAGLVQAAQGRGGGRSASLPSDHYVDGSHRFRAPPRAGQQ